VIRAAAVLLILAVVAAGANAQGLFGGVMQRPQSASGCSNSLDFSQACNSMYVAFPGV